LRERFGQDLPVLRLHSDRGGEFSSNLLRDFCRGEGILQSFTLPDSPQQNGLAERRIGLVMEVIRTSMIHVAAPHFLWPFAVHYATHQLNLWPHVSLPETSPTLRWTGEVGDASVFRVWGSRSFLRNTSADMLSARAIPCVFLGFPPNALGWQFYHPTSRRVFPSQDITFDESVLCYHLSPQQVLTAGAGGTGGTMAAGLGGARTRGTGAAGTGGVGGTGAGVPTGPGATEAGGTRAGGAEAGGAGAGGTSAGARGARGTGARGAEAGGAGAVDPGAGCAGAGGAVSGGTGTGGSVRRRPYFILLLQQVLGVPSSTSLTPPLLCPPSDQTQPPLQPASPLLAPSSYTEQSGSLTERLEPSSRNVLPVRTARRVPCSRPPHVPGTHTIALRPSSVPLRVPLSPPPESSLLAIPDIGSDLARAASPTVSRLLATVVTNPSFESTAASALVAELLDFVAACRLDCATALVAESESASPPSVREGEPDAPDIPTRRTYGEAIMGPYSSQWQAAMDAEMASWKSTGTYVDAVPPSRANIVDGMLIFGAPREWHDTLRTTLAALGLAPSTADPSLFLRTDTSLPPFDVPVYVDNLLFATADTEPLTLMKLELQKRYTCTHLGELRSYLDLQITRDRARRTITLTLSHNLNQVLQRFGFHFSSPQPTPLSNGHSLSAPHSDESVQPSGPYPELVGCIMYMMTCTRPDLAYPLSLLARYVAPGRHRKVHWDAAKRVLHYLCSTSGMGLVLGGRGPVVLTGHADASWVVDSATQRSSQGYTFSLGSGSPTAVMATPSVLAFDAEGRAIDFDVWIDDLQLFLQCDRADGLSLFDLTSGASPAPAADADATVRSQWATRDAAARLAVRRHLPTSERAHFSQYKSAQTLYAAVVARYSSRATAALSRLMLPYLFLDLSAFPTIADLITHLRTSDTRYRAALPAESAPRTPESSFASRHRSQ
ncbi:unnamed protein product, partial [Closterium sp. NIES-54]